MNINESNRLIAEFMGIKSKTYSDTPCLVHYNFDNTMLTSDRMKYVESWDWIMPVLYKIDQLEEVKEISVKVGRTRIWLKDGFIESNSFKEDSILACYKTVVKFIEDYNSRK